MASKATASYYNNLQQTLRKIAIAAGAVGVFLDIVSIIHSSSKRYHHSMRELTGFAFLPVKNDLVEAMLVAADIALFLGFLAVSIANGIVMNDMGGWGWATGVPHVMLYTYNSIPWLTCATLHLFTAGMAIHRLLKFGARPKTEVTCPDCQRKWHRGDARSKDGAEDSLLAVHDYDEDADGA
ncbi:MAG: hypothetical protein Q9213_000809 [Squamulea squamosa]